MNGPVFKPFFMNVLSYHKLVVAGERLKDAIVSSLVKTRAFVMIVSANWDMISPEFSNYTGE